MMFTVTKHYPHSLGLSAVFRQPNADSHCRFLHGYALAVTLVFEAERLDKNNWVIDFGSLKPIKEYLVSMFDHTVLIADDDPKRDHFYQLMEADLIDLRRVPGVGCEQFAYMIGSFVAVWLVGHVDYYSRRMRLRSCTVAEHLGNSATWENE